MVRGLTMMPVVVGKLLDVLAFCRVREPPSRPMYPVRSRRLTMMPVVADELVRWSLLRASSFAISEGAAAVGGELLQ